MSGRTHRYGGLALAAASILVLGTACDGDDPVGPEPGTLEVRLATPFADDAALLVRVTGPDLGLYDGGFHTQLAVDPGLYFHPVWHTGGVTVVLVGDLAAGPLIRFPVSNVDRVASYTATVLQAADRSNALRESVGGYALTVVRVDGS
ncbi:MAG: hypothetical protein ACN0LA_14135 [Candidatus Longimicrobiales bacterium M2_2A_002]